MNEPPKVKYTELIEVEKNIEPDYYVVAQYLHAFYLTVVPEYRCGSIYFKYCPCRTDKYNRVCCNPLTRMYGGK